MHVEHGAAFRPVAHCWCENANELWRKKKQQPRAHHYFIGRWWEMFILLLEIIFKITQLVAGRNWSMSIEWCEFVNQSLLHVYMNCVFSYSFCNNDLFNKTSAFFSCIEALSSCKNREFNGEKKPNNNTKIYSLFYFLQPVAAIQFHFKDCFIICFCVDICRQFFFFNENQQHCTEDKQRSWSESIV